MKTKLFGLMIAGIAILGLSMGTVTHAYTSALNPHDPATAPETYVIKFNDQKLKTTLNHIISNVPPLTTRSENQDITVKDARRVGLMYGGQGLDGKGIKDLEGIQYFINVVDLRVSGNTPTNNNSIVINALPLKALTNLKTLNVANNNLPQNILVDIIPHLTNLESLTLTNNRATDLAPILGPLNKLKDLAVDTNRFTNIDPIITKKDTLVSLNINANTLTNQELQKLGNLTNLEILLASAIRPRGRFSDISFIPSLTKLKHLHLSNNPAISSLEPVLPFKSQLLTLILNGNNFNKELFLPQIAQFTHLTRLDTSGNQFHDISSFGGINGIVNEKFALFTTQKSSISTKASIFPNPIKNRDGSIVPITDTADVINVDSTGIPNPQGTHLKITKSGKGTALVTWKAPATPELYKNFSGELTIHYDLDNIKPTATITSEPESSTPTRGPVTLTLQASEAIQAPAGWKEVPGSNGTTFTKEVTANGVVSLTITDLAGNPSENPITFEVTNIDTTGPEITINNPDTAPSQNKTASATVTEGAIAGYAVVPAGTTCDENLQYAIGSSVTLDEEGDNGRIVCFKAVDALGNASFQASNPVSGIDKTGPTLQTPTATLNPETETITFTIPEAQDPSGVAKYIYRIQECDADGTNCSTVVGTTEILFQAGNKIIEYPNPKKDKNRKYILKVQAEDRLGDLSAEQETIEDTVILTIKFDAGDNGSINPITPQKVFNSAPFSKITLPTPTPNPGYKFKDWTDTNGNTPPTNPTTPITSGTTYTANFEVDQNQKIWNYTVHYYLENTTNPVPGISRNEDTGNAYIGETITITPPAAPTGYKLVENQTTSFEVNQNNTTKNIYYKVDDGQTFTYSINYTKAGTVLETVIKSVPKANPL